MSIITSKPTPTAIRLSRLLDKPTQEIELFLDTFRAVPQARKNPPPAEAKSEYFEFYKDWLPLRISEIGSEEKNSIIEDAYTIYTHIGTDDFTSLLLTLDPKDFNTLTRAIASI